MSAMAPKRRALLLAGVVALLALVLVVVFTGGEEELDVEVALGTNLPTASMVDREDADGRATVRAFLAAGISCSPDGAEVMSDLSPKSGGRLQAAMERACSQANGAFLLESMGARRLDGEGDATVDASRWELVSDTGNLEADLAELRRVDGAWVVQ